MEELSIEELEAQLAAEEKRAKSIELQLKLKRIRSQNNAAEGGVTETQPGFCTPPNKAARPTQVVPPADLSKLYYKGLEITHVEVDEHKIFTVTTEAGTFVVSLTEAASEAASGFMSQSPKEAVAAAIDVTLRDLSASSGLSLLHASKLCSLPASNRVSMGRKFTYIYRIILIILILHTQVPRMEAQMILKP